MTATAKREERRAQAIHHADELLAACAALRTNLRAYESAVRKVRTRTARAAPHRAVADVTGFATVRSQLTRGIGELEDRRRAWRNSLFRYQAEAGMSLAAIARDWGFSRQLVSRLINEKPTAGPAD